MAIRKANILGVLNEMYESENRKYEADRNFAMKGMSLAAEKDLAEQKINLDKQRITADRLKHQFQVRQYEEGKVIANAQRVNQEDIQKFQGLKTAYDMNAVEVETIRNEIALDISSQIVESAFGKAGGGTMNYQDNEMKIFIKRLAAAGFADPNAMASDIVAWHASGVVNTNTGEMTWNEGKTNNLINRMFADPNVGQGLQNEFNYYGDDDYNRGLKETLQDNFFKFTEQNNAIFEELQQWNLLGDNVIGDKLVNMLSIGTPDKPIDMEDTQINISAFENFFQQSDEDKKEFDTELFEAQEKDLEGMPIEIQELVERIGHEYSDDWDANPLFFDNIEKELKNEDSSYIRNGHDTQWLAYQDNILDLDTSRLPIMNVRTLDKNIVVYNKEKASSKYALNQLIRQVGRKKAADKGSNNPQYDYSESDRTSDARNIVLYKLQLDYINHQLGESRKEKAMFKDLQNPMGRVANYTFSNILKPLPYSEKDNLIKIRKDQKHQIPLKASSDGDVKDYSF